MFRTFVIYSTRFCRVLKNTETQIILFWETETKMYTVETYKSLQKKFQKTVTICNFFFKSPIGIGYFFGKSPKKRNDLNFCNDLPCNDLYVSTVRYISFYLVKNICRYFFLNPALLVHNILHHKSMSRRQVRIHRPP